MIILIPFFSKKVLRKMWTHNNNTDKKYKDYVDGRFWVQEYLKNKDYFRR